MGRDVHSGPDSSHPSREVVEIQYYGGNAGASPTIAGSTAPTAAARYRTTSVYGATSNSCTTTVTSYPIATWSGRATSSCRKSSVLSLTCFGRWLGPLVLPSDGIGGHTMTHRQQESVSKWFASSGTIAYEYRSPARRRERSGHSETTEASANPQVPPRHLQAVVTTGNLPSSGGRGSQRGSRSISADFIVSVSVRCHSMSSHIPEN